MAGFLPTDTLDTADSLDFQDDLQNGLSSVQFAGALAPALKGIRSTLDAWKQSGPRPLSTDNLPIVVSPEPGSQPIQTADELQATYQSGQTGQPVQDTPASSAAGATPPSATDPSASAPAGASPTPAGAPSAMPTNDGSGLSDEAWARQEAARLGIDPDTAVKVGNTEGGFNIPGRQNSDGAPAYSSYQDYIGGPSNPGLGDEMLAQGIDPRDPAQSKRAITYNLEHAKKNGWSAFQGAAAHGIGNWDGIGQAPAPSSAATAQPSTRTSAPNQDVDQAALDDPDKWVLCGPVAAVIAAGRRGANWTVAQAKQISQAANLWDARQGMHGLQSEVDLLNKMNIPAKTGSADAQTLISEAQSGNTPIVSTPNHYFVLTGYDPATGTFDTTTTGGVYKAGARRMTLDQIERVGGGIQGAAYMDNPSSPTPSVATQQGDDQWSDQTKPSMPSAPSTSQPMASNQTSTTALSSTPLSATSNTPISPSADQMLRQPLNQPMFSADQYPSFTDSQTEPASSDSVVTASTSSTPLPSSSTSLPTDASSSGVDASAPAPAQPTPGAGAFQDDQTDSGYVQPDMAPGPPATQPIPQPAQSPIQPLYDMAGNVIGAVHTGLNAAGSAVSNAAQQAPGALSDALDAARLPNPIRAASGANQALNAAADVVDQQRGETDQQNKRQQEIWQQAAAWEDQNGTPDRTQGLKAVTDPAWRAANPDLAAEYDQINDAQLQAVGQASAPMEVAREAVPALQVARPAITRGIEAVRSGVGRVGSALDENAGRVAAQDAERAGQGSTVAAGTLGTVPEAPAYGPTPPEGFVRRYHGTSADFPSVDTGTLNERSLWGPGYYITDDPRVAGGIVDDAGKVTSSGYAQERGLTPAGESKITALTNQRQYAATDLQRAQDSLQRVIDANPAFPDGQQVLSARRTYEPQIQRLQAKIDDLDKRLGTSAGPNVRALDVPADLNLLDTNQPSIPDAVDRVGGLVEKVWPKDRKFGQWLADNVLTPLEQAEKQGPISGETLATTVRDAANEIQEPALIPEILKRLGFDGITHPGGLIRPMYDEGGQAINHTATVIFPDSVSKIRNATAGTYGGAALGNVPDFPGAAPRGKGFFDKATPILGQGVASAVSGGIGAATAQQLGDPNDPNRAAKGFVAGALIPPLAARGMGAMARRLNRAAPDVEGALSMLGNTPPTRRIAQEAAGAEARGIGATTEAFGINPENKYQMRFRVVDLGDLIPSHTDAGAPHPNFPPELQPRLRDRAGSQLQIDRIAKNLNPDALLTDVRQIDRGPMIVGPDGVVESGNGRVLALRRAAQQYPEQYAAYANDLKSRLPEYGLKPSDVQGIEHPVLVRERLTDVNRPAFAAEANQSAVLAMSPYEQALQDARNLPADSVSQLSVGPNQSLDQAIMHGDNRPFVRAFMATLPGNEQAALLDSAGNMNAQGLQRVKAALFASTYGGESGQRLTRAFFESLDPTVKNVESSLQASLPDIAKVEAGVQSGRIEPQYSISDDVSKAVDAYARLKASGQSVGDYLAQADLFGNRETTPIQDALIQFMDENRRSQRPLRDLLKGYAEGVEALPPLDQVGMFGPAERAGKGELLDRALTDVRANTPKEIADGGLFTSAEQTNSEGTASANTNVGPDAAAGQELARPPSAGESARLTPATSPAAAQVARTPAADLVPRGGPEGSLAAEGAPEPLARPGAIPDNVLPSTGGPEGTLAHPGAPPTGMQQGLTGIAPAAPRLPAAIERAQALAARQAQAAERAGRPSPPSAWDWIKAAGYSGIYSPATLVASGIEGAQELALAQPKEAIRALAQGRPGAYAAQARAQIGAVSEGIANLGKVLMGNASESAAVSGGSRGTAGLSDRVTSPGAKFAARVLERPGEILTEAPDAVFRPMFEAQGMSREASQVASEMKLGSRQQTATYADDLLKDAQAVRGGALPTLPQTQQVLEAGQKYADQLGFKGQPGQIGQYLGKLSKRDDALGVLASFLIPFPSMAARMSGAALKSTPGAALIPGVRRMYPSKFDMVYDQAFGTLAATGVGYWAMNGGITGSGPDDATKRSEMIAQGWQPNSTLVGGYYIPNRMFGRFEPMLNTAGELHDALAYGTPNRPAPQIAADLVKRGSTIATDQIGLSGLADLHDMLSSGFSSQFPGWAARSMTRYLPYGGVLRAAAASLDPVQRRADKWNQGSPLPAIGEQLKTAIPGLRQTVPAAQDVLGRPAPNPQQGLGAFIPRTTSERNDPLIRAFQDARIDIGAPPSDVSGVALSPSEQRRYQQLSGQMLEQIATSVVSDPGWKDIPLVARQKILSSFQDTAHKVAEARIKGEASDYGQRYSDATVRKAQGLPALPYAQQPAAVP